MTIKLIISWIAGMSVLGGASAKTYCYFNCKSKAAKKAQLEKAKEEGRASNTVS